MTEAPGRLSRTFRAILARSRLVLLAYALLLVPAVYYALGVRQDNSVERLIVEDDPDAVATRKFGEVFGTGEYAVLMAEADDPLSCGALGRIDQVEKALQNVPGLSTNSALGIYRRAKAGFEANPDSCDAFRRFVTGTDLFRKQGIVGDHYLSIGLILDAPTSEARKATLTAIDEAIAPMLGNPAPLSRLSRLGQPYVNRYIDETQQSAHWYFVLFVAFVVVLNLGLYRSRRTLAAFLVTLAVTLAVSVGWIGWLGGSFTIVSPMVPMTILVTATSCLVYLHSRYVECPPGRTALDQQVFALENKFLACTASVFATAVGFAALAVSPIRPIRDLGEWTAAGLLFTWIILFTLFPALQKEFRTPMESERRTAGAALKRAADWLPRFTYRWRWPLVLGALAASVAGGVAMFGVPGRMEPLRVLTDPVEYMDPSSPIYQDTRRLGKVIPGLSVMQVWLKGDLGSVSEPEVLGGLERFQQALETTPGVGAAVGPTSVLKMMRYVSGESEPWPKDADGLEAVGAELEGLMRVEPMLQRFVQPHELAQTNFTVISHATEHEAFVELETAIRERWKAEVAREPALAKFELRTVGMTPLNAKMSRSLVPTLVESFQISVAIIFVAFLLVFRSGSARIMAMIPSLFAILVMSGVMRLLDIPLNVATILIASTVLGTSENDQVHFFWHFQEGQEEGGTVEEALRHTLLVAGRAIFFATMINAGGFLAFGLGALPSVRQFGTMSALAFVLSMVADFLALPAALWILLRAKPDPR